MRWELSDNELTKFFGVSFGEHIESPSEIRSEQIKWKLFIYPLGYSKQCKFVEIWLSSSQHSYATNQISVDILLHVITTQNIYKWKLQTTIKQKANNPHFHYRFPHKVSIDELQNYAQKYSKKKKLTITCTVDVITQNDKAQKTMQPRIKSLNKFQNASKQISKQRLITLPSHKLSSIHRSNANRKRFRWKIAPNQLESFRNCRATQCFSSEIFDGVYKDSQWQLKCYPNGSIPQLSGMVAMFLDCVRFPSNKRTTSIQIIYDFECCETNTFNSNCHSISNGSEHPNNGVKILPKYVLHRDELLAVDSITFCIDLLVTKDRFDDDSYHNKECLGVIDIFNDYTPFRAMKVKWTIPVKPSLFGRAKMIISERFDIWCLRYSQGIHSNDALLELYLISTPAFIDDIEFVVTLRCSQFGIEWKKKEKLLLNERKYVQWKNVKLQREQIVKMNNIEFECDIQILNFYNQKKRKVCLYRDEENEKRKECK